ncbi:MAG: hypothetical protein AAEJ53_19555 [Myxococcota bacterium]
MILRKFALVAALVSMASGAQAVTLDIVGGQLMGASDVLVDGDLYSVQFLDGTCSEVYNGCDSASDFTFQTLAAATLASSALSDQVLVNTGTSGEDFDSVPSLTNGCFSPTTCSIFTLYKALPSDPDHEFDASRFINNPSGDSIGSVLGVGPPGYDWSGQSQATFAVWSVAPEPAPVPALQLPGIALLVASLLGVGAGSLRRQRRASPRPGLI